MKQNLTALSEKDNKKIPFMSSHKRDVIKFHQAISNVRINPVPKLCRIGHTVDSRFG